MARSSPGCDPDTSNASGAPAPRVHSPTIAATGSEWVERAHAELFRHLPPVWVDLSDQYVGTRRLSHAGDQQADGTATDHQCALTGEKPRSSDVVHRHRHGLHESGAPQIEIVRQAHQNPCWYVPPILHGTRQVDAHEVQVLADVLVAGLARRAGAAPPQWHHGDGIAHRPAFDTAPDGCDATGHLVADHGRRAHPLVHGAVEDVQVGPADPRVRDIHLDASWFRSPQDHVVNRDRPGAGVVRCSHWRPAALRARVFASCSNSVAPTQAGWSGEASHASVDGWRGLARVVPFGVRV